MTNEDHSLVRPPAFGRQLVITFIWASILRPTHDYVHLLSVLRVVLQAKRHYSYKI